LKATIIKVNLASNTLKEEGEFIFCI